MARAVLFLGLAGYLWWFGEAAYSSFPLRSTDAWSFGAALALLCVVPVCAFLFLREGCRTLARHPDLLLPRGILALLNALLGWMIAWQVFYRTATFDLLGLTLGISAYFVLQLVLHVLYAAWVTRTLLERDRTLAEVFALFWRDVPRTALFMAIGQFGLLAGAGVVITAGPQVGWLLLLAWGFAWNGLTYAVLPAGLAADSIGAGIRATLDAARRPRIWGILLLHYLLAGMAIYLYASGTRPSDDPGTRTTFTKQGWYVQAEWLGAYEDNFHWHDKLMAQVVESPSLPLAVFWLGLLGTALAIVVKAEVVHALGSPRPSRSR